MAWSVYWNQVSVYAKSIMVLKVLSAALFISLFSSCLKQTNSGDISSLIGDTPDGRTFSVAGTVTYDSFTLGYGPLVFGINYASKIAKPARRIMVEAVEVGTDTILQTTTTNDNGAFALLNIERGKFFTIRASARILATNYTADGVSPDGCNGSAWDIGVVDFEDADALYVLDGATPYSSSSTTAALHAATSHDGTNYTSRNGAPFALLDSVVTTMELYCQNVPTANFPALDIEWNPVSPSGNAYYSHQFTPPHKLRLRGIEDLNTDEYDPSVIGHEFGHYIDRNFYRSDSMGGSHSNTDIEDGRLAWGEGYATAFGQAAINSPMYLDTSGADQGAVGGINLESGIAAQLKTPFSEFSISTVLWKLFAARGAFDRIHNVIFNYQKISPSYMWLGSFAAHFNALYGSAADNFQTIWTIDLSSPLDALCIGVCNGTGDTADVFDTDNDLGISYAPTRKYPFNGAFYDSEFWRSYKTVASGTMAGDGHEQHPILGAGGNKFGERRWYRYTGTGALTTIKANNFNAGVLTCADAPISLYSNINSQNYFSGLADGSSCKTATFNSVAGFSYVFEINSSASPALTSWDIVVTP